MPFLSIPSQVSLAQVRSFPFPSTLSSKKAARAGTDLSEDCRRGGREGRPVGCWCRRRSELFARVELDVRLPGLRVT